MKNGKIKEKVREGHAGDFEIHEDGSLRMEGRWCIPEACEDLKLKIMEEGHNSPYSMHPGGDKLYKDLKKNFWWARMKLDIAEFVSKCLTCQKVKSEHKRPQGKVQPLDVPGWKWDSISMDFVVALPKGKSGMIRYGSLQQVKMIQGKIKAAQDRQKSYADLKRREEEYELRRYIPDKSHVLQPETVQIDENLSYEERPIKILDSKKSEEATWEAEADMRKKYPELFAEG
ncbi:uncharacterized protein LOC130590229 [Beta vulgaris subsp. vulgaris]|uniref:uncharacterized protein LOC130590229 n=1 Tax=Beta vulgaris subsp. vulgaris TaxID=3555 RepID=UPI00254673CB|nr:uncharacterized protein LOC130590229 [Beta vulgaris subsp. vulgaris]